MEPKNLHAHMHKDEHEHKDECEYEHKDECEYEHKSCFDLMRLRLFGGRDITTVDYYNELALQRIKECNKLLEEARIITAAQEAYYKNKPKPSEEWNGGF